jgi:hypothetical protein
LRLLRDRRKRQNAQQPNQGKECSFFQGTFFPRASLD